MDIDPHELLLTQRAESLSNQVLDKKIDMGEATRNLSVHDNEIVAAGGDIRPLINDAIREKEQAGPSKPLTQEQQQQRDGIQQRLLAGVGVDWKPPEPQIGRER